MVWERMFMDEQDDDETTTPEPIYSWLPSEVRGSGTAIGN